MSKTESRSLIAGLFDVDFNGERNLDEALREHVLNSMHLLEAALQITEAGKNGELDGTCGCFDAYALLDALKDALKAGCEAVEIAQMSKKERKGKAA